MCSDLRPSVCEFAPPSTLKVLLLGNAAHPEFRDAIRQLRSQTDLTIARDVAAAAAELESADEPPALLVVAQIRPGEFCDREINLLRQRAPLVPFVALLGSLCEGETRSGSPWPGVVRVYWRQWPFRAGPELAALRAGRCSAWSLPATAGDEERLLCSASQRCDDRQGLAAVAARRFELADWLVAACRVQGLATLRTSPERPVPATGVEIVLWDAGLAGSTDFSELARLKSAYPGASIIALADFPRIEDEERLLGAGVAAVLSKPVTLAELCEAVGDRGAR
jgi:CheY-like chemotaxis protein